MAKALPVKQHELVRDTKLLAQRAERPAHTDAVNQWRQELSELMRMITREPANLTKKGFAILGFECPDDGPASRRAFEVFGINALEPAFDVIADIECQPRKLFVLEKPIAVKLKPCRLVVGRLLLGKRSEVGGGTF